MLNFQQNGDFMKKYFAVLKKCALFRQIREEDYGPLLSCFAAQPWHYDKGEVILGEGDPAEYVGIVLSGAVQVVRVDYYGNRSILAKLGPAGIFAEAFACAGVPTMPVSVVAAEDTEILLLQSQRIIHSCGNACHFHNQMIHNLLQVVARKNLVCNQKIEIMSKRTTREKLMAYLLLEAKRAGRSSFSIPYDRQELADYLEVDRSGLSAEISKLRRENVLLCRKNEFTLL